VVATHTADADNTATPWSKLCGVLMLSLRWRGLPLPIGLLAVALGLAPAAAPPYQPRVARLIEQLGSDEFALREQASRALEAVGQPALPALRQATCHADPEIRHRAQRLLRKIEVALYHQLRTFPGGNKEVYCVAFSRDGRTILSASWDNRLHLWDAASGKELRSFRGHERLVRGLAFSPNGSQALSASLDATLRLWDVTSARHLRCFKGHGNEVLGAAFSPDGKLLVSGSNDKTVRLWSARTGKEVRRINDRDRAWVVNVSPDGRLLASAGGYKELTVRLWDVSTGSLVRCLVGHTGSVNGAVFTPDGSRLLSCGWDGTLRLWDVKTGVALRIFKGHVGEVGCVALSSDGRRALSGGNDRTMRLWDVQSGRELRCFEGHTRSVNAVAFAPEGRRVLSGSSDQTMRLWAVPGPGD
jgi:WD40 repeat protein